ncbi:hypothetical protein [Engelhardtia mirabilis]|uniref:Uncharacterized protein n=1 Tax=Engelhardtia mirabilis TaxID=2528011 RepID=A0A518BL42_9BACT|nr:hypothetical protein Pla133_27800 [Planctomycetes bacterium Pla133]QDV02018.1 hypothetical protein Pla86_27790 [Planctomycetes bacterium Pla86]
MNQREASRKQWSTPGNVEGINSGSLQRIADATEIMAQSYQGLIDERNRYERLYTAERADTSRLERSNAALRGVITRMKRKGEVTDGE